MIAAFALTLLSLQAPTAHLARANVSAADLGITSLDPTLPQPAAALPEVPPAPLAIRVASPSLTNANGCMPGSAICRHLPAVLAEGRLMQEARVTPVGWEVPGTGVTVYGFIVSGNPGGWEGFWWTGNAVGYGCGGAIGADGYQVCLMQAQIAVDFVEQSVGLRHGKEIRAQQEAAGTAPRWTSGGEAPVIQSSPSTISYSSSGTSGSSGSGGSSGESGSNARF